MIYCKPLFEQLSDDTMMEAYSGPNQVKAGISSTLKGILTRFGGKLLSNIKARLIQGVFPNMYLFGTFYNGIPNKAGLFRPLLASCLWRI